MKRRSLMLASAGLCAGLGASLAQAQGESTPRKYGVMSLLGETIVIAGSRPTTGSRLDQNDQYAMTIPDAGFDVTAMRTAEETIKKIWPQSTVALYAIQAPKWVERPMDLFTDGKLQMSPKLVEAMKADGAGHLLLVTRYRGEAQVRTKDWTLGSGRLEGLGYYLDREAKLEFEGKARYGFIAPYVYVRLSLVDLASGAVLRHRLITASRSMADVKRLDSPDPWDSISAADKLRVLNEVIEKEVSQALPALLGPQ